MGLVERLLTEGTAGVATDVCGSSKLTSNAPDSAAGLDEVKFIFGNALTGANVLSTRVKPEIFTNEFSVEDTPLLILWKDLHCFHWSLLQKHLRC